MRRRMLTTITVLFALMAAAVPVAPAPPALAQAAAEGRGSINQVAAWGLMPGSTGELLDADGTLLQTRTVDEQGAVLFRDVAAGTGYDVRAADVVVADLTVSDPNHHPDPSWYDQQVADDPLEAGYGYLTTRDGTTLSVNVTFPIGAGEGPWPVVVLYSGYDPAQPSDVPAQEGLVYMLQGYVVVGVNMRGTGCSGGAFEFMEDAQATDGYDVIETVARQPWSTGDVGMVGISYSGYSQLYVAATQPPSLKAITPLSPFSDTYSAILYPGGILNDGFAVDWAREREEGARPAARSWARNRIANGDTTCAENQMLRLQSRPLLQRIYDTPFSDPDLQYLNTETFIDRIQVPTYLASQWQDEQTGGSAANLVPLFDPATKVFGSFTNGTHVEPMSPSEMYEALTFMDLYVAEKVPEVSPLLAAAAPGILAGDIFGAGDRAEHFAFPDENWSRFGSHGEALTHYESRPHIRLRWENGGVPGQEGLPNARATTRHTAWPVAGTIAEVHHLHPDGRLAVPPSDAGDSHTRGHSTYIYDQSTKRRRTFEGSTGAAWHPHPDVSWDVLDEHHTLSFVTDAFSEPVAYAGQGSVDLWLRSSEVDTDLEVTLTEVRPDGHEVFVQSGWLRAGHRALDPALSTELLPHHTHRAEDYAPLPPDEFTPVRVELFPFAHVIRPGSRLRLNVEAPGGNQPFWAFDAIDGTATNDIAHSVGRPSRVVLPRLPSSDSPALPETLPPCELDGVSTQTVSLRNQPCRPYAPARVPTEVAAVAGGELGPDATTGAVVVSWTAPPGGAPDGYRLVPVGAEGGGRVAGLAAATEVAGSATSHELSGVAVDVPFEVRVQARYGDVWAPLSSASPPVVLQVTEEPPATTVPPDPDPSPDPEPTSPTDPGPAHPSPAGRGSASLDPSGRSRSSVTSGPARPATPVAARPRFTG